MTHTFKTRGINLFLALSLVTLFTTLQSSTCSKSDDVVTNTTGTPAGTWRVSLYWDSKDETSKFTGYNFTFAAGGQVTATNGASTVTGTWTETSTRMILDFGADPLFSKISDDYLKEEKTSVSIKLKDDNPLKDEKVQFVKN
ncbi:MAG: hypothetical protein IPI66_04015 [Chitinophagaceae bacterium]|nr:hypothetical protein [Chitinophagaceae bacterium]MBL0055523.1 hypothetical protein [Chitinophagaceae bacterium]